MNSMKARFRLYRRGTSGVYYCHDNLTGKQESLGTRVRADAVRLFHARNEAHEHPSVNLQIARAYLAVIDPEISRRTWQVPMDEMAKLKQGATQVRWLRATRSRAFDGIRRVVILETRPEHFLRALEGGGVSTNVFLRRLHNFALDMNWLPWPVIPRKQWPKVRFKDKRAITLEEHQAIVAQERNPERKAFYQLAWHLGAAQSDIAHLQPENVDWTQRVLTFSRQKTGSVAQLYFDDEVAAILQALPRQGPFFPYLATVRASDRATEFKQRCQRLGIQGVTLHSYRYAWAERAKQCGYPERFAQAALGHNSKAVHRAYARRAVVKVPSLEKYERVQAEGKVIPLPMQTPEMAEPLPLSPPSVAEPG